MCLNFNIAKSQSVFSYLDSYKTCSWAVHLIYTIMKLISIQDYLHHRLHSKIHVPPPQVITRQHSISIYHKDIRYQTSSFG
ncbi:hypothetical protein HZ326_13817 [Fusarium oxysporum f. sp. albedinis]|nr:hypothetical protein HZ326_13817 [Fusarium oxysporum f. sp. albedinis]